MGETTEEKDDAYFKAKNMTVIWIIVGAVSGVLVTCILFCGLKAWCCRSSKTEDQKKAEQRKKNMNKPPSELLAKKREQKKKAEQDNMPYRNKSLASLRGQGQKGNRPETRASVIYNKELVDYTPSPENRTSDYGTDINMANYSAYDPRTAYRVETPRDKSPTDSFNDNMRRPLTTQTAQEGAADRYLTQYRKNLASYKGKRTSKGGKKIYTA
jgi:hypothetical protein